MEHIGCWQLIPVPQKKTINHTTYLFTALKQLSLRTQSFRNENTKHQQYLTVLPASSSPLHQWWPVRHYVSTSASRITQPTMINRKVVIKLAVSCRTSCQLSMCLCTKRSCKHSCNKLKTRQQSYVWFLRLNLHCYLGSMDFWISKDITSQARLTKSFKFVNCNLTYKIRYRLQLFSQIPAAPLSDDSAFRMTNSLKNVFNIKSNKKFFARFSLKNSKHWTSHSQLSTKLGKHFMLIFLSNRYSYLPLTQVQAQDQDIQGMFLTITA
jgi:hypothetical protein